MDNGNFQSWMNANRSSCFVCYGTPGSGKSVLTASVVEELTVRLSRPQFSCCYFYCDYSDIKTLNTATIIGTLARQLIEREVPEELEDLLSSCCDAQPWILSLDTLSDILEKTLRLFSDCLVIVDGIDELPREHQVTLLAAIHNIMRLEKINIKVLVTARSEENDIRCALQGPNFHQVELCPDFISADLRVVIKDEVSERIANGRLVIGDPDIKNEIVEALSIGAKDM
jgi:Cdc6-like AAA superfamily ATPase